MNICDERIQEEAKRLSDLLVKGVCFVISVLFIAGIACKIHYFIVNHFPSVEFRVLTAIEVVVVITVSYLACQVLLWAINYLQRNFGK